MLLTAPRIDASIAAYVAAPFLNGVTYSRSPAVLDDRLLEGNVPIKNYGWGLSGVPFLPPMQESAGPPVR